MIDWENVGLIASSHLWSAACCMGNYRVSSFQLTRSARLSLAYQVSATLATRPPVEEPAVRTALTVRTRSSGSFSTAV